jgi:hypothetical protein
MNDAHERVADYVVNYTGKYIPKGWRACGRDFERDGCPYVVRPGLLGWGDTQRWIIVSKKSGLPLRNRRGGVRHFRSPGEACAMAETEFVFSPIVVK